MRVSVLTIFPDFFGPALDEGMVRAAREKGRLEVGIVGLREFTSDSHRTTDDYPFGGGVGMVMKVEPIDLALRSLAAGDPGARPHGTRVALLSPQGRRFDQPCAIEYSGLEHLVLVCGRYKAVDERVRDHLVDEELSIGDYVLSGGELAAAVVIDALGRLQEGALNDAESAKQDSFEDGLLDCPHYTRSDSQGTEGVPAVLLSGDHAAIRRWRRQQSLGRTWLRRPDLLARLELGQDDAALLAAFLRDWQTSATNPEKS